MPILVKGDDVRSGTKAGARYGRLQCIASTGVNGLITLKEFCINLRKISLFSLMVSGESDCSITNTIYLQTLTMQ